MLKFLLCIFSIGLTYSFFVSAAEQKLVFKDHGKLVKELSLEELKKISQPIDVSVHEPHLIHDMAFHVLDFNKIVESVYGKAWNKSEEILFTCSDGYQPSVPVSEFKSRKAFFAFGRVDQTEFTVKNVQQNEGVVQLGPFYLVWENLKNEETDEGSYWPYQVTTVDLIQFVDRFKKTVPPAGSSKKAIQGFLTFRKYCMSCHAINGEGGGRARDLNQPQSILEARSEQWLKKFIENPRKIRPEIIMPAKFENRNRRERNELIGSVIEYLKAIAKLEKKN